MGLYAIVDMPHPFGLAPESVTRAVLGERLEGGTRGAALVQLRAKQAPTEQRVAWLEQMLPLCERAQVPLVVNDDVDAATAVSGVGVHLGQNDPGSKDVLGIRARAAQFGHLSLMVGLSTHSTAQLREAGRQGPDYLALGPILRTQSKDDPEPTVGFEGLIEGCRHANAPVVAIGGLGLEEGRYAIECGAAHAAVIQALVAATEAEIRERALLLSDAFAEATRLLSLEEVRRMVPVLPLEQLEEIARWSDDIGLHIEMGLPARFRPVVEDKRVMFRRCDVIDLLYALQKHPEESWEQWTSRTDALEQVPPVVRLRREPKPRP